jgi:AhpD family alkylhydroperoxidase
VQLSTRVRPFGDVWRAARVAGGVGREVLSQPRGLLRLVNAIQQFRRVITMQPRMKNPALVLPDALQAMFGLGKAVAQGGVAEKTLKLVDVRASQINGCALCLDMHNHELRKMGETDERLFSIAAWREAPYFTDAERAALALTEALTRLADHEEAVSDRVWDEVKLHYDEKGIAALLLNIGKINVWNRLNAATHQPADGWRSLVK